MPHTHRIPVSDTGKTVTAGPRQAGCRALLEELFEKESMGLDYYFPAVGFDIGLGVRARTPAEKDGELRVYS